MDVRDHDSLVEECAAMLMSDDVQSLDKGIQILGGKYMVRASKEAEQLASISQEMAVYGGGVVLQQLWKGLTSERAPKAPTSYATGCQLAFSMLSPSKVVVERCLRILGTKERSAARDIYRTFSAMAVQEARTLKSSGPVVEGPSDISLGFSTPLQNLSNFTQASRIFREAIKDVVEGNSIFESLGYLVSRDFLSKLNAFDSWKVRDLLSKVVGLLASAEDSQLWALDKGLLKLLAAILEGSPFREPTLSPNFKPDGSPVQSCIAALFFLLDTEASIEKMRAHNALSGLKPQKHKINAAPGFKGSWSHVEARMLGKRPPVGVQLELKKWRLKHSRDGYLHVIPVVCSWKLCTQGPETVEKMFGKCALCQIARYCSKEHQKLHWPSHKIHCQASRAKTSDS